jgi:hypothetical protein
VVQLVAIVPCIPLAMPGQRAVLVQKTFRATTPRGKPTPELKSARERERSKAYAKCTLANAKLIAGSSSLPTAEAGAGVAPGWENRGVRGMSCRSQWRVQWECCRTILLHNTGCVQSLFQR